MKTSSFQKLFQRCTGFILAGGKSSRMGQDKALLEYEGKFLVQYPIRVFQQLTRDVRLIGDPERYADIGLPVIPDCVAPCGPLGGIYTGLKSSPNSCNLFLACDMPLMRVEFFEALARRLGESDAALMQLDNGNVEPLCAIYCSSCLPAIEASFVAETPKVTSFLSRIAVAYLSEAELREDGLSPAIFTNVNTPEEFRQLLNSSQNPF
jgi:molybdopterin-guanine dinucleotide biosynthesis protein A